MFHSQAYQDGKEKARLLAKVAVNEIGANLLAINLYPFGVMRGREKRVQTRSTHTPNTRPILLVHGVVHNPSAFFRLKKRLLRSGFRNIFTLNYTTRHGSLLKMVDDLEKRAEQVMKITGSDQIDIVAHSLGGLVARHYMTLGEGRGRVKKLVTLGTAHQGTLASHLLKGFVAGTLSRDLRAESRLIKTLSETSLPEKSKMFCISAKYDITVWPQSNSVPRGFPAESIESIEVSSTGHMGLLYSREVLSHVMNSLKDA